MRAIPRFALQVAVGVAACVFVAAFLVAAGRGPWVWGAAAVAILVGSAAGLASWRWRGPRPAQHDALTRQLADEHEAGVHVFAIVGVLAMAAAVAVLLARGAIVFAVAIAALFAVYGSARRGTR